MKLANVSPKTMLFGSTSKQAGQAQGTTPTDKAVATPVQQVQSVGKELINNWQVRKYGLFAVLLAVLTTLVVLLYYYNHPGPEPRADTWSYLYVVDRIQVYGQIVNFWRLPGYPLFIVLIYTLQGQGNLAAVSEAQAILFVLATLEIYVLAALILRRAWVALLIGLLVGINIPLLSYVKPIMSEALGIWLFTSLALAVVVFLSTFRMTIFWLITVCTLLLFLTRPEWVFLPILLFAYLLLVAAWRGAFRRLLPHALASLALCYAILGGYAFVNARQNHFPGVTWIQNINELGKVVQYRMQDEAPPQYANISHLLDTYVSKGIVDPYVILAEQPMLVGNDAALSGKFAESIIVHHPVEFLGKSVPIVFSSLTVFYEESGIAPAGPFASTLIGLDAEFRALYAWNIFFPVCAAIWLLLLFWRKARSLLPVQMMGAVVLMSLYGLVSTTLGAYRNYDYMRIHTLFDPLMTLVIWGTLLLGAILMVQRGPALLAELSNHSSLRQKIDIRTGRMLIASICLIGSGLFTIRYLHAHGLSSLIGIIFFFIMSAAGVFSSIHASRSRETRS